MAAIDFYINVEANPTRFAAYQDFPDLPNQDAVSLPPATRFFCPQQRQETTTEYPLELGHIDNVLIGRNAALVTSANWPILVDRYFQSLLEAIGETFKRASAGYRRELVWTPRIRLTRVETYWEFASDDPVAEVTSMAELARQVARNFRNETFSIQRVRNDLKGNSAGFIIDLPNQRHLRIYAKTNMRVRIEVIHNVPKARKVVPVGSSLTVGQLPAAFADLADDAVAACTAILTEMRRRSGRTQAGFSWYEIPRTIEELQGFGVGREIRRSILSALMINGSVSANQKGPMLAAIMYLMKLGLLRRAGKRALRFTVTGPYRNALADLMRANIEIIKQVSPDDDGRRHSGIHRRRSANARIVPRASG